MIERVIEERAHGVEPRFGIGRADRHRNDAHLPLFCRGGKAEPRFVGKTRLPAVAAVVCAEQFVGIRHLRDPAVRVVKIFEADAGILMVRVAPDERAQHDGGVLRAGILRILRQSRAIGKEGIFGAELFGARVHLLTERPFAARKMLRDRYAGIVGGAYGDAFEKFARRIAQPRIEKDL